MSSFFYHSAQTLLNQYADRFPLLKITQQLDWQAIEHTLTDKKSGLSARQWRSSRLSTVADVSCDIVGTIAQSFRP